MIGNLGEKIVPHACDLASSNNSWLDNKGTSPVLLVHTVCSLFAAIGDMPAKGERSDKNSKDVQLLESKHRGSYEQRKRGQQLKVMGDVLLQYVQKSDLYREKHDPFAAGNIVEVEQKRMCNNIAPVPVRPTERANDATPAMLTITQRREQAKQSAIRRTHKGIIFYRDKKQVTPIFLTSQSKWNAQVRNETGGVKQKSSSYMLPLKITQAAHNEEFELGILCRDRLVTFRPRLDPENIPNSASLSHETPPSRLQTLFDRDPDVSQKKQIPYIPAREPKLQKPLPRRHRQFVQLSNKDLEFPQAPESTESNKTCTFLTELTLEKKLEEMEPSERARIITDNVVKRLINARRHQISGQPRAFELEEISIKNDDSNEEDEFINRSVQSTFSSKLRVNKFISKLKHKARKTSLLNEYSGRGILLRSEYDKIVQDSRNCALEIRDEDVILLQNKINNLRSTKKGGRPLLSEILHVTCTMLLHAKDRTVVYVLNNLGLDHIKMFLRYIRSSQVEEQMLSKKTNAMMAMFSPGKDYGAETR
jgi:hypothetical protein